MINLFSLPRFAGIFFVLPCIENYSKVDLRTAVIDIPPQEVCLYALERLFFDSQYYNAERKYERRKWIFLELLK